MTIICYRDGVMAADSAMWAARSTIIGHTKKITRGSDGSLIGVCGDCGVMQWFPEWLADGAKLDAREKGEDLAAIVVSPRGEIRWFGSNLLPCLLSSPFTAAGACEVFAMGALAAGASAPRAVELCIQFTDGAAGEVQVVRLAE